MNSGLTDLIDRSNAANDLLNSTQPGEGASSLLSGLSVGGVVALILFSIVGMIYIRNGRRDGPLSLTLCGVVLLVYPYFVYSLFGIIAIGVFFTVLPYFYKFG